MYIITQTTYLDLNQLNTSEIYRTRWREICRFCVVPLVAVGCFKKRYGPWDMGSNGTISNLSQHSVHTCLYRELDEHAIPASTKILSEVFEWFDGLASESFRERQTDCHEYGEGASGLSLKDTASTYGEESSVYQNDWQERGSQKRSFCFLKTQAAGLRWLGPSSGTLTNNFFGQWGWMPIAVYRCKWGFRQSNGNGQFLV